MSFVSFLQSLSKDPPELIFPPGIGTGSIHGGFSRCCFYEAFEPENPLHLHNENRPKKKAKTTKVIFDLENVKINKLSAEDESFFSKMVIDFLARNQLSGEENEILNSLRFLPLPISAIKKSRPKKTANNESEPQSRRKSKSPQASKRKAQKTQRWFERQMEFKERKLMWDVKQKQTPCKYFLSGRCQRGDACIYGHNNTNTQLQIVPLCESVMRAIQLEYKSRTYNNGCISQDDVSLLNMLANPSVGCGIEHCPYSHDAKKFPCIYFHTPGCSCKYDSSSCRFSHVLPLKPLDVLKLQSAQKREKMKLATTEKNDNDNDDASREVAKMNLKKDSSLHRIHHMFSSNIS